MNESPWCQTALFYIGRVGMSPGSPMRAPSGCFSPRMTWIPALGFLGSPSHQTVPTKAKSWLFCPLTPADRALGAHLMVFPLLWNDCLYHRRTFSGLLVTYSKLWQHFCRFSSSLSAKSEHMNTNISFVHVFIGIKLPGSYSANLCCIFISHWCEIAFTL